MTHAPFFMFAALLVAMPSIGKAIGAPADGSHPPTMFFTWRFSVAPPAD